MNTYTFSRQITLFTIYLFQFNLKKRINISACKSIIHLEWLLQELFPSYPIQPRQIYDKLSF